MHTAADPYRAPVAPVADQASSEVSTINIWSPKGRLGRVRYIGYSIGIGMLINFLAGLVTGLAGASMGTGASLVVMAAAMIAGVVIHAILSVQRAHDFNTTGWVATLAFVPLLNFLFWFIPGTDGQNRFGHKTPPNSKTAVALACIIPAVMFAGILAAIAIPAYQDYVERAEVVQGN